jgi:gamma-glutamylcyclotransferase
MVDGDGIAGCAGPGEKFEHAYLAYGSNMWPRRIELRLGACEVIAVVRLDGYALRFHKRGGDGSGKCDAFHTGNAADRLYGVAYGLSQAQRDKLDEFEGPGYASRDVAVRTPSGMITAYAYVARAEHVDVNLRPFDWYKSIVVAGARRHALPADYVARIAGVDASPDADGDRDALHRAILGEVFTSGTNP